MSDKSSVCPVCKVCYGNVDFQEESEGVMIESYTCSGFDCVSTWKVKWNLVEVYEVVDGNPEETAAWEAEQAAWDATPEGTISEPLLPFTDVPQTAAWETETESEGWST